MQLRIGSIGMHLQHAPVRSETLAIDRVSDGTAFKLISSQYDNVAGPFCIFGDKKANVAMTGRTFALEDDDIAWSSFVQVDLCAPTSERA
jgi:hypothetical protein